METIGSPHPANILTLNGLVGNSVFLFQSLATSERLWVANRPRVKFAKSRKRINGSGGMAPERLSGVP